MISPGPVDPAVFTRAIEGYLRSISAMGDPPFRSLLGVSGERSGLLIPFFGRFYRLTPHAVTDGLGRRPPHAVSVVLCRYLLGCPGHEPAGSDLVTFKDFRDAAPYAATFTGTVEQPIAGRFSGRLPDLRQACRRLGGRKAETGVDCDHAWRFRALPKIPLILLFNDRDDDFSARCTLLFERRASGYLDPESLALIGHRLLYLLG